MRLYGLIGYPLSHSFSQKYFAQKFEKEEINDCRYLNFPIPSVDDLKTLLRQNPDLRGLNVTIPYKEKVIPFLDEMSDVVKQIRACNCIKIIDGKLTGYNTDVTGFEKSFIAHLKPVHKKALVLGTGGASKAVQFVLSKLRIPFLVVSRAPGQNEAGYEYINRDNIADYQIIVNTTPLGMQPNTGVSPSLPYLSLSSNHYLFDLIYNPSKTIFLESGEKKGAVIQNGYEMLVNQADESWEIWNS